MIEVKYITHACFEISGNKTILIDPFFNGNETNPHYNGNPDIVLVTHEHFDHADAGNMKGKIVAPHTVNIPNKIEMKIGDEKVIDGIKIKMIRASHYQSKYPTGYIITMDGKNIAHLGDTYLDGVDPLGNIDLLLVPIGGHYTMNIEEALKAVEIIKPKMVIPMHYNTFKEIKADPNVFKSKATAMGYKAIVLNYNESIKIQ